MSGDAENSVQLPRLAGGSQEADAAAASDNQGAENSGTYVDYLNSDNVPEDYRPHVEPFLKQIQDNVESKFRDHAEYRKGWEPYETLTYNDAEYQLQDYDPEGLAQLIAFAELTQDPEQFKEWWTNVGQQQGFYQELAEQFDPQEIDDDLDDELDDVTIDDFREVLNELLDERFAPFEQRQVEEQNQQQIEQASEAIDKQMEQLHEQYGEFDEQAVYRFAYSHSDSSENPILAGFQDYMNFVGQVEQQTVEGKVNAPAPPESGEGPANTSAQPVTDWDDAKKAARERIAALNR
jgi:hypothetical protein